MIFCWKPNQALKIGYIHETTLMMNDDLWKEFGLRFTKQSLYLFKKRCWLTNAEEMFGWSSSFNDVWPISKATDGNLSQTATSDL